MAKKKSVSKQKSTPTFEVALEELQQIVKRLESGKLSLDQSLVEYEAGIGFLRQCYESLDNVEQKIRLLVDVDENGVARTKDFSHSASHSQTETPRKAMASVDDDSEDEWDDDDEEYDDDESSGGLF